MNQATATYIRPFGLATPEPTLVRQQLAREIMCLEGQLDRMRTRNDLLDFSTLQTYEDMIASRKEMLESL